MIAIRSYIRFSHNSNSKLADRLNRLTEILTDMPKDPVASRKLKQERIAKAAARRSVMDKPSGAVSMHVLGNGGPGNPASLMLVTDHYRYLFNCGEGSQRLAVEHGMKVAKLSHVFLTHCKWKNCGGLPGMSMTLQSMGIPALTVHSPVPILNLYEMTRLFSVTAELDVNQKTADDKVFTDPNITVTYVLIRKSPENCNNGDTGSIASDSNGDPSSGKRIRLDDETGSSNDVVMNYICKLPPLPGALNIKKCFELQVPKGPALGQLKNGQDYIFPDGRVVKSADVVDPDDPGPVFLVIDCPDTEFLDSLTTDERLSHYQTTSDKAEQPRFVFHFTPPEVMESIRYKEWMSLFPESVIHVRLNEKNSNKAFTGAAALQAKLRCLDQQIFPPVFSDVNHADDQAATSFVPAETMLKLFLRPSDDSSPVNREEVARDLIEEVKEFAAVEGAAEAIQVYKEAVAKIATAGSISSSSGESGATPDTSSNSYNSKTYPIVSFLGTASAAPSKHRNTSCIHVEVDANAAMLFDCGEGSYGQLFRLFGPDRIENELRKIRAIFISHLHADHHLGLIRLLKKRSLVTNDKVALFLPQACHNWLLDYDRVYERISHLFYCKQNENLLSYENFDMDLMEKLSLVHLQTARVVHCRDSFGITITTLADRFKIVYSGDAMPSPFLAVVGQDCDVLIHEATMEDDLLDEAVIKRHSTTSQAIGMGRQMRAKHTILTHFSQRYAKVPLIDAEMFEQNNVGCAFDNMRLRPCDYDRLVHLNKALNVCFRGSTEQIMRRGESKKTREKVLKQQILQEDDLSNRHLHSDLQTSTR
jgi:ribonuclease Z